jgi:hypothetical protein
LQNKLRTERSNQDAQITELQNKEKELVVELTQKFNERLAQERQKITALSNKVSQLGGIDI